MARISSLESLILNRNSIHEPVEATYTSFSADGATYLQIDTYGSTHRQIRGKKSQSIQFDRDSAVLVYELLKRTFNL